MKNQTKHTASPWVRQSEQNQDNSVSQVIYGGKDGLDVVTRVLSFGGESSIENAKLIAAAPELLEACKEAIQWIGDELSGREDETGILFQLQQAIAKAEGRER